MYLGETSKPLEDLQTLIGGYYAALSVHGLVEDVPSMAHFSTWLRLKTGWSMSCGWAYAIAEHSKPDTALAAFFSLVEQFRTLVPAVLSSARLSERNRPTGKRAVIGLDGRIARPDRVDVVQYAPEPIHFLRFHYATRIEDQHSLYTSDGSDATTLDHAKEWVCDELCVDRSSWQDR
jgi:hypothetical protein